MDSITVTSKSAFSQTNRNREGKNHRAENFAIALHGVDPIYHSAEFLAAENAEALARIREIYLRAGRALLHEISRAQGITI